MLRRIKEDVQAVLDRDPAVRSAWEVILCYPGFHAVVMHRLDHWLYRRGWFVTARFLSQVARFFTGIEIHPGARLGRGVFIDHGMGVVIGETAEVGDGCTLYQGVTLGGTGKEKGKRHPTLGRNVMVATGAKVLGNIVIGDNSKVGAGAVVVKDVPPNCTVVGVPGRIVIRDGQRVAGPDLNQVDLPDPEADAIAALQRELLRLERRLHQVEAELGAARADQPDVA
ncbi:MAG: serine O-acetyltransferase, partial [Bacillota bacterium]